MVPIRFACLAVLTGLLLPACSSQLQPRSTYTPPPGAAPEEIGEVDTGDLQATAGHEGDQVGAKVIRADEDGDERVIEVEVPVDPDSVDRVQVYTTGPGLGEGSGFGSPVLTREAQIIENYENNNVGIQFRLPNSENTGFRLKLIDHPDDDWPPRRYQ